MESLTADLRGIGEMSRDTGLTVSALRFYDRAGLLVPAEVDPDTGYRRYAAHQVGPARLVAGLRRVGMPLADIARVLAALPDSAAARRLVDAHLRRLERGLADARRELSRVHQMLDSREDHMTTNVSVAAAELAAALDAVRFAAGADPALAGVLIETGSGGLELVATDRHRLAVARVPAIIDGPPVRVVAPTALVDQVRRRLDAGPITLTVDGTDLTVETAGYRMAGAAVDGNFPDYRRLLAEPADRRQIPVDVHAVRPALVAAGEPVVVLAGNPDGGIRVVAASDWNTDDPYHVAVNPEFLLQALDAGATGQLVLDLDGPIRPLAIRTPSDSGRFSVLMPVRI